MTDTDRRGAQVFATDLAPALERLGWRVKTVALAPGAVGGLDVPTLGHRRLAPTTLGALRRELAEVDIAIAHGSSTLPACALATIGTGRPFVYRQISDSLFWARSWWARHRVSLALGRSAHVVALWTGAADTLVQHFGVARERISVVPNGVPSGRFTVPSADDRRESRLALGLDADQPTVLFMAALAPEKGPDVAIDAVAQLGDVRLLVAGDGPEAPGLRARADRVAPHRVVFCGQLADPTTAYRAADVVVLPSRGGDSMPAVLIEAGLMGLPAVATAVEGIPEIVSADRTGLLVEAAEPQLFARALGTLLSDRAWADGLGTAARARCLERFTIEPIAAAWSEVLLGCLEPR